MIAKLPMSSLSAVALIVLVAVFAVILTSGSGPKAPAGPSETMKGPVFEPLEEPRRHRPRGRWYSVNPEFVPLVELTRSGVFFQGEWVADVVSQTDLECDERRPVTDPAVVDVFGRRGMFMRSDFSGTASDRALFVALERRVLNAQTATGYRFPEAPLLDHLRLRLDGFADVEALRWTLYALVQSQIRSVELELPRWLEDAMEGRTPAVLELSDRFGFGCDELNDFHLGAEYLVRAYERRPQSEGATDRRRSLASLLWLASRARGEDDDKAQASRAEFTRRVRDVVDTYGTDLAGARLSPWGSFVSVSITSDPDIPVWLVIALIHAMAEHHDAHSEEKVRVVELFAWHFGAYWHLLDV